MKTKTKLIIMLGLALLTLCIFNSSNVYASTTITKDYLKTMVDVLPTEMTVDVQEVEYLKAEELIKSKVSEIWKAEDIDTTGVNVNVLGNDVIYLGVDEFHKISIYLYTDDGSVNYSSETIKLTYNNTNSFNTADEQIVKNLKLDIPEYFTYDIYEATEALKTSSGVGMSKVIFSNIEEYLKNKYNDSTLTFLADSGTWGDYITEWGFENVMVGVFKNGILYDVKNFNVPYVCKLTIPVTIENTEKAYIEYATPIILKALNDTGISAETITLTKGAIKSDVTIENGYTIEGLGHIILEQEEVKDVVKEDSTTGIKLDADTQVVPADTKLVVEKVTTGTDYNIVVEALGSDVEKFVAYDITLTSNNATIQPNGKVKISLPIPEGYDASKILVYRIAEDGTKTKLDTKIDGDYVTFETDHFSNYVIAQEKTQEQSQPEQPSTDTNKPTNNNKLDETPKTGIETNVVSVISLVAIISLAAIIIIKKK